MKKHCYYITESGYSNLNDNEGVWKEAEEDEWSFEKFYPKEDDYECKEDEFEIASDFGSGGWVITGNLEMFEQWVEETGHDPDCIMDEIPEPDGMEECYE